MLQWMRKLEYPVKQFLISRWAFQIPMAVECTCEAEAETEIPRQLEHCPFLARFWTRALTGKLFCCGIGYHQPLETYWHYLGPVANLSVQEGAAEGHQEEESPLLD